MTGGRVVVLGSTGRNFAAGMSGGIAYIYDADDSFARKCNMGMVGVAPLAETASDDEMREVQALIAKHVERTGSVKGQQVLSNWEDSKWKLKRVMPYDYERVLLQRAMLSAVGDAPEKKSTSASA
jgi:glutamate synthase (NADPH) large chain